MENPWLNVENECNTDVACDLARLRVSAAIALKKIESTYQEIMGCTNDDTELLPVNIIHCENDLNNSNPRQVDSEVEEHVLSESEQTNININQICRNCHKAFTLPMKQFKEPLHFQFYNTKMKSPISESRTDMKNQYIFNEIEKCVGVEEHPDRTSSKVSNQTPSDNKNKVVMHKCPLKVTVPEPFQMTLRDEDQKVLKELKIEQLRKELNEENEKEMQVTFHSSPIPGHVYLPIYQKLVECNKERKLKRKKTAEDVKNSCKPLNLTFTKKNLYKTDSLPNLSSDEKQCPLFKAQPVPKHILSHNVSEKLKNKEAVRKFRIMQRAQETLQQSSLPFSSRKSFSRSSSVINLRKEAEIEEQKYGTKRQKPVNTFSRSYCKEVMKEWNSKVEKVNSGSNSTVPPFEKVDKKNYESRYNEFLLSQASPFYDIPIRMTAASMLREKEIRRELSEKSSSEQKEKNIARRNKEIREQLVSQLKMNDLTTTVQGDLERKLQNYRLSRKLRQQEYERELMEMKKRVGKNPLLIERQTKGKKEEETVENVEQPNSHSTSEASPTSHSGSDDESQ